MAPPTLKITLGCQDSNGQMETIGAVGLLLIGNSLPGHLPKARLLRTTSGRTNYRYVNHQELHCKRMHAHTHAHIGTVSQMRNSIVMNCHNSNKKLSNFVIFPSLHETLQQIRCVCCTAGELESIIIISFVKIIYFLCLIETFQKY